MHLRERTLRAESIAADRHYNHLQNELQRLPHASEQGSFVFSTSIFGKPGIPYMYMSHCWVCIAAASSSQLEPSLLKNLYNKLAILPRALCKGEYLLPFQQKS
ncbi:hypothetical protein VTI28DRAFT_2487 [Corynascus sepedonium]